MSWQPTIRWLTTVRGRLNAHTIPSSALVRRVRWRSRLALSGAARGPLVLVSDMARPAGGPRREQQTHRRAIAPHQVPAGGRGGARLRPRRAAHVGAVVFLRYRN